MKQQTLAMAADQGAGFETHRKDSMNDTTNKERKPLAVLEGRPIFEGDILYDLEHEAFRALSPWHADLPLRMESVGEKRPGSAYYWATGTHWKGQQVLFWSVEDIPAPADRTLGRRPRDQLAKWAERRRKRPTRIK